MKKGSKKKTQVESPKSSSKSSKVEVQTGPGKKRTKDGYHAKKEFARKFLEHGQSRQDTITKLVEKFGVDRRYAYSLLPPVSEFPMKAREGQQKRTVFRDENGEITRTTPVTGGKQADDPAAKKKTKKTGKKAATEKEPVEKKKGTKKTVGKKGTGKKSTPAPPVAKKKGPAVKGVKGPKAKKEAKEVESGEEEGGDEENEENWDF